MVIFILLSLRQSNAPKSDIEVIDRKEVDELFNKAFDLDDQGKYEEAITW